MTASLPRGPHALPKDIVHKHQRQRLFAATAAAIAELGYSELTVRDLIERARVSRRSFYQLFDSKLECVLATHDAILRRFEATITRACSSQGSWPEGVVAAIAAALEFATESPDEVRFILTTCHTEPKLAGAARAAYERFENLLREGRERCGEARARLELTDPAVVGALATILGSHLCTGAVAELPELQPQLVQVVLAPYLGYGEAERVALAA